MSVALGGVLRRPQRAATAARAPKRTADQNGALNCSMCFSSSIFWTFLRCTASKYKISH